MNKLPVIYVYATQCYIGCKITNLQFHTKLLVIPGYWCHKWLVHPPQPNPRKKKNVINYPQVIPNPSLIFGWWTSHSQQCHCNFQSSER